MRKVVIIGPESTGKSTLTSALAEHFAAPAVPEYAREYLIKRGGRYVQADLLEIAKGQMALEDQLAYRADDWLFCDTDLHVVKVWSEHKYGTCDPWILHQIKERPYDTYLVTDIDMPWEADPLREHPDPKMRQYFFDLYVKLVKQTDKPYQIISGTVEERLAQAISFLTA